MAILVNLTHKFNSIHWNSSLHLNKLITHRYLKWYYNSDPPPRPLVNVQSSCCSILKQKQFYHHQWIPAVIKIGRDPSLGNQFLIQFYYFTLVLLFHITFCINNASVFNNPNKWQVSPGSGRGIRVTACAGLINQLQSSLFAPDIALVKRWHSNCRQLADGGEGHHALCCSLCAKKVPSRVPD